MAKSAVLIFVSISLRTRIFFVFVIMRRADTFVIITTYGAV